MTSLYNDESIQTHLGLKDAYLYDYIKFNYKYCNIINLCNKLSSSFIFDASLSSLFLCFSI